MRRVAESLAVSGFGHKAAVRIVAFFGVGCTMRDGERVADDSIYLSEDRRGRVKEVFKRIAEIIRERSPEPDSILDAGCATGDFLYYLRDQFPGAKLAGLEVSPALQDEARRRLSDVEIFGGSILDPDALREGYSVITCSGVLEIFDDPAQPIGSLLHWLNPGGMIVVQALANDVGIDLLTRYRRVEAESVGEWEVGWNIFCRSTYERAAHQGGRSIDCQWERFRMPFDIAPSSDPMRSRTASFGDEPHQQYLPAGLLVNPHLFIIQSRD